MFTLLFKKSTLVVLYFVFVKFLIACSVFQADESQTQDRYIKMGDEINRLHGIFGAAGLMRSSEMGHENYRSDLDLKGEQMKKFGQLWVDEIFRLNSRYNHRGMLSPYRRTKNPQLQVYATATYAYHMHHRAGRWSDHDLEDKILYTGLAFMVDPGVYVLKNLLDDQGKFYHDKQHLQFDKNSMSHGMASLQGHVYAWVRWKKPDGKEDMGQLPHEVLKGHMVYDEKDLLKKFARPTASFLIERWDDQRKIFVFDESSTWHLESLGSLMRGLKSVYETLYMFGNEEDQKIAAKIAEMTGQVLTRTLSLTEVWGLPETINFGEASAMAYSDRVSTKALWNFVNHIGSGFSLHSGGDGMSPYRSGGALGQALNQFAASLDQWLNFGINNLNQSGLTPELYSYHTGQIIESTSTLSSAGLFTVAASNNYRRGEMFERARDWNGLDPRIVQRSRLLYDVIYNHALYLKNTIKKKSY